MIGSRGYYAGPVRPRRHVGLQHLLASDKEPRGVLIVMHDGMFTMRYMRRGGRGWVTPHFDKPDRMTISGVHRGTSVVLDPPLAYRQLKILRAVASSDLFRRPLTTMAVPLPPWSYCAVTISVGRLFMPCSSRPAFLDLLAGFLHLAPAHSRGGAPCSGPRPRRPRPSGRRTL